MSPENDNNPQPSAVEPAAAEPATPEHFAGAASAGSPAPQGAAGAATAVARAQESQAPRAGDPQSGSLEISEASDQSVTPEPQATAAETPAVMAQPQSGVSPEAEAPESAETTETMDQL